MKCVSNDTNEEYGVKILRSSQNVDAEIETLKLCKGHPNIVSIVEVIKDDSFTYIVTEWLAGKELFKYAQEQQLDECEVRGIFKGILHAISDMHSKKIAHRDLKLENIKFTGENPKQSNVKILDFGFACKCDEHNAEMDAICYTLEYAAPEILSKKKYTECCDLWSLGVILYTLLCGHTPFTRQENDSPSSITRRIKRGSIDYETERWKSLSGKAKDLIRRLLTVSPDKRIKLSQIIVHEWLNSSTICKDFDQLDLSIQEQQQQQQNQPLQQKQRQAQGMETRKIQNGDSKNSELRLDLQHQQPQPQQQSQQQQQIDRVDERSECITSSTSTHKKDNKHQNALKPQSNCLSITSTESLIESTTSETTIEEHSPSIESRNSVSKGLKENFIAETININNQNIQNLNNNNEKYIDNVAVNVDTLAQNATELITKNEQIEANNEQLVNSSNMIPDSEDDEDLVEKLQKSIEPNAFTTNDQHNTEDNDEEEEDLNGFPTNDQFTHRSIARSIDLQTLILQYPSGYTRKPNFNNYTDYNYYEPLGNNLRKRKYSDSSVDDPSFVVNHSCTVNQSVPKRLRQRRKEIS